LYYRGYSLCPAMADAIAASHDYRIPLTGSFCPVPEPVPGVRSVRCDEDPASGTRRACSCPGFRNAGNFCSGLPFLLP
jgi:hypothetical protein